jgi:hypothetical protein
MSSPVTKDEASLARKSAAPTISSGSAIRFCSVAPAAASRKPGTFSAPRIMSVMNGPGASAFTRTPSEAHSAAIVFVSWSSAALLAA